MYRISFFIKVDVRKEKNEKSLIKRSEKKNIEIKKLHFITDTIEILIIHAHAYVFNKLDMYITQSIYMYT